MEHGEAESIALQPTDGAIAENASPASAESISQDEARSVLERYELGKIHSITDLRAGSALSPKAVVESERGKMLLKRRARGLDIPTVVGFAHEVLCGCLQAGICVPPLVGTRRENNSMLQMHDHVYELFVFIEGTGYTRTAEQAHQSGALMRETHNAMDTLQCSFEASVEPIVIDPRRAAGLVPMEGFDRASIERAEKILAYGEDLVRANNEQSMLVHGDWHPGNMIYQGNQIVAVCDFDNTRAGSRRRELAQALVHFSIRQGADAAPDQQLLGAFFDGYCSQQDDRPDPRLLASLMPAVLLDEALASANQVQGAPLATMLGAVLKRAVWLDDHHAELTARFTK